MHVSESEGAQVLRAWRPDWSRLARIDAPLPKVPQICPALYVPAKPSLKRSFSTNDDNDYCGSVSENKVRFANAPVTLTSKVIRRHVPRTLHRVISPWKHQGG